jgi:hypothetical protein
MMVRAQRGKECRAILKQRGMVKGKEETVG